MADTADTSVETTKQLIIEGAARIASEGNGLPLVTFMVLAEHMLSNLAGYRHRGVLSTFGPSAITAQDIDYVARMLQSVYGNLQDVPMDIA